MDKRVGEPCRNLQSDLRCGIHHNLREQGFAGCAVFDCFGAGQHVTQVTFGGRDWRRTPEIAKSMFAVFTVMRQLRELLWYLTEALTLPQASPLRDKLDRAKERTERLADGSPDQLTALRAGAARNSARCERGGTR